MPRNLGTAPTGAPIRGSPSTKGSVVGSIALIRARLSRPSASPERSATTPERSRILPLLSRIPGFSPPVGPKRNSFIVLPLLRFFLHDAHRHGRRQRPATTLTRSRAKSPRNQPEGTAYGTSLADDSHRKGTAHPPAHRRGLRLD